MTRLCMFVCLMTRKNENGNGGGGLYPEMHDGIGDEGVHDREAEVIVIEVAHGQWKDWKDIAIADHLKEDLAGRTPDHHKGPEDP